MKLRLVALLIITLQMATANAAETFSANTMPGNQARTLAVEIENWPRFNFTRVFVLRMSGAHNEQLEVISLEPRLRKAETGSATTAIAFTRDRAKLVLVSADGDHGWRLEVPVAKLVRGQKLAMPVLGSDGKVTPSVLTVSELISMP